MDSQMFLQISMGWLLGILTVLGVIGIMMIVNHHRVVSGKTSDQMLPLDEVD